MPFVVHFPRHSLRTVIATVMLAALLAFTAEALSVPNALGASTIKAAACSANVRVRPSTTAQRRATLRSGTRVTVATKVSGGWWRVSCAGRTITGRTWYRISAINGKSVRKRYGVTYVYAATGLFRSVTATPATPTAAPPTPADCGTSLQALINATPTGGTLVAPACVYRESVTINRPMTVSGYGAIIDGRDASGAIIRTSWMIIDADDVTIDGFTMRYANDRALTRAGALRVADGRYRPTIRDCDLGFATYADLAIGTANNALVTNCNIHHGGALGIHLGGGSTGGVGNRIVGNRIHDNDIADRFSPEWESGGVKATAQRNLLFQSNDVYGNHGPGLWCDIYCHGTTYSNNRVHDNTHAGIMEEVSYDGRITGNVAWNNGFGKAVWGWGAGIVVSSSTGTEVAGNTLAWNARSCISIISQNRTDWPAVKPYGDISVHDNVCATLDNVSGIAWLEDWSGSLFSSANLNQGRNNRYWFPTAEDGRWRFAWAGYVSHLASFNSTPAEETGSYLTKAAKDTILTNVGVRTTP